MWGHSCSSCVEHQLLLPNYISVNFQLIQSLILQTDRNKYFILVARHVTPSNTVDYRPGSQRWHSKKLKHIGNILKIPLPKMGVTTCTLVPNHVCYTDCKTPLLSMLLTSQVWVKTHPSTINFLDSIQKKTILLLDSREVVHLCLFDRYFQYLRSNEVASIIPQLAFLNTHRTCLFVRCFKSRTSRLWSVLPTEAFSFSPNVKSLNLHINKCKLIPVFTQSVCYLGYGLRRVFLSKKIDSHNICCLILPLLYK